MNSWKLILSTLIIFGAGVITGGLLVSHVVGVHARATARPANAAALTPWHAHMKDLSRRMERELKLTPEQRAHIEKFISDSQERTKALWKPIAPEMNREMQDLRNQIREELTPDQQTKFDVLLKPHPAKKGDEGVRQRRIMDSNAPVGEIPGTNAVTNAAPAGP